MKALLCIALCSCAPTLRIAHRCPTLAPQLVDFVLTSAALAYSASEVNAGRTERALVATSAGMSVALASNLAECR